MLALATGTVRPAVAAPTYDWTKTPEKVAEPGSGTHDPYITPDFESRASLADTMAWIKRTLEQYGTVKNDPYDPGTTTECCAT